MRQKFAFIFQILVLVLFTSFMSGCWLFDDDDSTTTTTDPEPPDAPEALDTVVSGIILDASTNLPISSAITVAVTEEGTATTKTRSVGGDSVSSFSTSAGFVSFTIADGTTLPVDFTMTASGTGYITSASKVAITASGDYSFEIRLTPTTVDTSGDTIQVNTTTASADNTGATTAEISVDTSTGLGANGDVTITIPSGTVLRDADGDLVTGNIEVVAAFFSNQDTAVTSARESSMNAFPGGINTAQVDTDEDGTTSAFVSGGFATITIKDDNGNEVTTLSQPITIVANVPADTVNTDASPVAFVQAGDTIPVWSFDESTGEWTLEGNSTLGVLDGGSNTLPASYDVTHLTSFNWGYKIDTCNPTFNVPEVSSTVDLLWVVQAKTSGAAGKGFYTSDITTLTQGTTSVQLTNMPDDIPVNLLILNSDGTVTFVDNDYSDICTGSNNDISITYDDSQTYADVTVNVKWACESPLADQTVGVPSTPLALYSTSGGTWYGTTNSSGTYTFSDIPVNAVVSVVAEDRRPTERISSGDTDSQKLELFSVTSGGVSKTITFTVNATDTECVGAESGSTGGTGGSGS